MNNTTMQRLANRLLEVEASMDLEVPSLSFQHMLPISAMAFRIQAAHAPRTYSEEGYQEAVATQLEKNFRLIPSSIQPIGQLHGHNLVSFLIKANVPSKAFSAENLQGMKHVTANVFSDDENTIWKCVGKGPQRRLVQNSTDDYAGILTAKLARKNMITAAVYPGLNFANGDYVMYFNPNSSRIDFGTGLNIRFANGEVTACVVARKKGELVPVEAAQVIECFAHEGLPEKFQLPFRNNEAQAALSQPAAQIFLDYMRRLYAGTAFFTKLEQDIAHRRSMGDDGGYTTTMKGVSTF